MPGIWPSKIKKVHDSKSPAVVSYSLMSEDFMPLYSAPGIRDEDIWTFQGLSQYESSESFQLGGHQAFIYIKYAIESLDQKTCHMYITRASWMHIPWPQAV